MFHQAYILLLLLILMQIGSIRAKWVWHEDNATTQKQQQKNSISFSDVLLGSNLGPKEHHHHQPTTNDVHEDEISYLDVLHPDSPYGLIHDVLKQNGQPPLLNEPAEDFGGLRSNEVWLSQGDLLVLKGGITNSGLEDDEWPPLDDFEAPYREPILAPTTNSLVSPLAVEDGIISILPPPPPPASASSTSSLDHRKPRHFFLPSIPLNAKEALPDSEAVTEAPTGFLPVTPSWLTSSTSSTPPAAASSHRPQRHNSLSQILFNAPRYPRQSVNLEPKQPEAVPSYWSQIATLVAQPQLSSQRPGGRRPPRRGPQKTNLVTVKHGIYPIFRSRRQRFFYY